MLRVSNSPGCIYCITWQAAWNRLCFVILQQAADGCARFNQANHGGYGIRNYTLTLKLETADT